MSNIYEETEALRLRVQKGEHRDVIGGMWDELGLWQFEFCRSQGLKSDHHFLDVGCGSLRGGVHFVRYLEPDHYAGLEVHKDLLDAGYDKELTALGLREKLNRKRLVATGRFDCSSFDTPFDMAIAQSVFTHIPINQIRLCLSQLARTMRNGGRLFATYFEISEDAAIDSACDRGNGILTRYDANPYHYRFSDLEQAAAGLNIGVRRLGDVGHPRGQYMAEFTFYGAAGPDGTVTRDLPAEEALGLAAGADHYRAYVGPPRRFDFMSSTQFALLHSLGMREEDQILDVGCGSLRLGRLLIPFLRPNGYAGIDPNTWLIEEGIRHEIGMDAIRLKTPAFASNSDFDFSGFGRQFDFIIAQSVATHTGPDLLEKLIRGAASALTPTGIFLFSYIKDATPEPVEDGWHYPDCVGYTQEEMLARLQQGGLAARPIPWFHPAASWMLAARNSDMLPTEEDAAQLTGHVVARSTDTKGYTFRS